ncbi:alpha/beta hydrolase [Ferrovibrio sp.]|uniref:alpha/beta fold hydrolase n=1 Tax=Ferrovibrio sp. TaxID=1917215 RepID=UPI0025C59E92|nr:alpha/beta hydrolase [Ferrovibrio sp.]
MRFNFGLAARAFLILAAFLLLAAPPAQVHAQAQDKIGVLLLHGKNPGSQNDPNLGRLKSKLSDEGMITLMPDMPWSARRYIDGDWDKAMAEIDAHVQSLRGKGATKIVIAGHSMGCPAAMGYAAKYGKVDALVLLAPGHVPYFYNTSPNLKVVRDSMDEARRMVAAGDSTTHHNFNDINQGRAQQVRMTAPAFLSYFAAESDAEMSVTAPRIPAQTAVIWVIGNEDPLLRAGRGYVFDKLPSNPKSQYLQVTANHLTTPVVARDAVAAWIKQAVAR